MSDIQLQGLALIILMVPLPLISIGATVGIALLWWLGLALLAVGGVIPAALRFVSVEEEQEGESEETQSEQEKESDDG